MTNTPTPGPREEPTGHLAGVDAAWKAVDACGGTYTPEQKASGYAEAHSRALDLALERIKQYREAMTPDQAKAEGLPL